MTSIAHALLAIAMLVTPMTALAGTTGPDNICKTEGPVKVCNENGFGQYYTVEYSGYLTSAPFQIQPCRPDYVAETDLTVSVIVNGGAVQTSHLVTNCLGTEPVRIFGSGFSGPGVTPTKVEIYFSNSAGQYDSQYGANYTFQF